MNFIEKKIEKILDEKGIKKLEYPEKEKYTVYKYPIKDEITEEILKWKEISDEELQKLPLSKRRKIRKIGEKIFDEKKYLKDFKNYEKSVENYKKEFNKELDKIINKKVYDKFLKIMNTLYDYGIEVDKEMSKEDKEEFEREIYDIINQ